jgi:cytidylate kinase
MIVTIDGPAGAGKSTAARRLAQVLGFRFLDTGAMYRAIAWAVLQSHGQVDDVASVLAVAWRIRLDVDQDLISVDGQNVSDLVRTPEISAASSTIAQFPEIRELMVSAQREIGGRGDFVCEGRDQGTVVFPDALCKFFLTASPECRARRRLQDLKAKNIEITYEEILLQQQQRDHRDSTRQTGPLTPAADAIVIDTTELSLKQVLDRMRVEVQAKVEHLLELDRQRE